VVINKGNEMDQQSKREILEAFASDNYENGGHWVVECFGKADYDRYIEEAKGDLKKACKALKEYWKLIEGRAKDCAW
jgi:hypothetical protein